jgi:putative restriction endonuclease
LPFSAKSSTLAFTDDYPELLLYRQQVETNDYFNASNVEDARKRVYTSIVQRQGQAKFRHQLLEAYDCQCPITGCSAKPVLEAAHIIPYRGIETNHISNGLLLRADIHTLFDLHLLSIQPETHEILIAHVLITTSYKEFVNRKVILPKDKVVRPDQLALTKHYESFLQKFDPL